MWHFIVSLETVPKGLDLLLAVIDDDGFHALEFPCRRDDFCWIDVKTGRSVDINPTHWREWTSAQLREPYGTWERTKHDVLNPTQLDSRLFSFYSSLRNRFLNSLQVKQVACTSPWVSADLHSVCVLSPEKVCMCGGVEGLL